MISPTQFPPSLWFATAEPLDDFPTLNFQESCDIVVVGAGFTGLRCALLLANAGRKVTVIDNKQPGWGASGRNGGAANPLLPFNSPDEVRKKLGQEAGNKLLHAAMNSANELFDIIHSNDIDCDAVQPGWVRTAHYSGAAKVFREQCRQWQEIGADIDLLDTEAVYEITGTRAFSMGALVKQGGNIHPLKYARGLAKVVVKAGATIFGDSPASHIQKHGEKWRLHTEHGHITADQVVLATNGYSDDLWPDLKRSIVPLISVQLATEQLSEGLSASILPQRHTLSDTRRVIYYGRKDAENRFLLGGHGFTEQFGDHPDYERVKQEAVTLYPQLKRVKWKYQWNGRLAITHDHLPHLHEPNDGILTGLGFNGRGVAMSNVMGRVMAERILGKNPRDLDVPITPMRNYPLQRFYRLGLPLVVNWMRFRDNQELRKG